MHRLAASLSLCVIAGLAGVYANAHFRWLNHQLILKPSYLLADGGRYSGPWHNDLMHGKGRIDWPNGAYYQGQFQNGLMHGKGELLYANQQHYLGELVQGQLEGIGKLSYNEQEYYQGQFVNDKFQGTGELRLNQQHYQGQFNDDLFAGSGTLRYANGDVYTGAFRAGQLYGPGVYTNQRGDIYAGEFINGELTGQGTFVGADETRYVGQFKDWQYQGAGHLTLSDGDQYSGFFKLGSVHGEGDYTGIDGSHYKGQFQQGRYHGDGLLLDDQGNVYQGQFAYGEFHGQGQYQFAKTLDGIDRFDGQWVRGTLIASDDNYGVIATGKMVEQLLYQQNALLNHAHQNLAKGDSSKIELYPLLLAGDGYQEVFRREIHSVAAVLDEMFNTQNRSLKLINSRKGFNHVPLATLTSLQRSLQAIAEKMDNQQDILLLYLASHGSSTFDLSLDHRGLRLPDLPAKTLATMLANSGIKWKMIIVSACYSGGFLPLLEDQNSIVISAAAADRNSFGCQDNSDYTWFGKAYFEHALPATGNFVNAFEHTKTLIKQWEQEQNLTPSQPQITIGLNLQKHLQQWQQQ